MDSASMSLDCVWSIITNKFIPLVLIFISDHLNDLSESDELLHQNNF